MTNAAQSILAAFEALSTAEQHMVAVEVLRRTARDEEWSEASLRELAEELFLTYEAEESACNAQT
jgi:hypothetical protein